MRQNYQISEQFPSKEEEEALGFPLFARKEYWLLHLKEDKLVPITIRDQQKKVIAFWCFGLLNDRLISPFNAPFTTLYLCDIEKDLQFISKVLEFCKSKYKLPIRFTFSSDLGLKKLRNSTLSLKILKVEIGSQLNISHDSFIQQLKKNRKIRKLNALLKDDKFVIEDVKIKEWGDIYEKNLIWRIEKGHQNFISKADMVKAKTQFPLSYYAFQLKVAQELVGAAFFLIIDQNLIYVYSLITSPNIDSKEPSLLLWRAIYDFAKEKNISTVDMGTSMLSEGNINKKLARYKKFIGGSYYKKYTLEC